MKFIGLILVGSLLLGGCDQKKSPADSEAVAITSSIEPEGCAVGETITLSVHAEFHGDVKVDEPLAKGALEGFAVVSRSISRQMNYINGKKSETLDIMLVLVAQKEGNWTIPAYEVKGEDGKAYTAQEIKVTVTKSVPGKGDRKRKPPERLPVPDTNDGTITI